MRSLDLKSLPTPCYIVDESLLIKNLKILDSVQKKTGCKILLAQKAYSMFSTYPLIGQYLKGTTASSLFEARLGYEEMGGETHIFAPAYKESEFDEIIQICDHIVFNSFSQWNRYKEKVKGAKKPIACGIRINPEYSEVDTDLYDPCGKYSRLGTTMANFDEDALDGISGLHFHTMCEQNADTLERTAAIFEEEFSPYFTQMKWLNFGGGHHITREDYQIDTLVRVIDHFQSVYNVQVYLEPGEAIALNAGFLVTEVLDTLHNGMDIAILDTSAACHMPDVLEMPYRPEVMDAGKPGELPYTYRLGCPTCLAGDIIGDYSFAQPLQIGDRMVLHDMAIYTMVKNNTFNGINLPAILLYTQDREVKIIKTFGYEDFKTRLS